MGRWELKTEGCKVPLARDSESGEWIGHSEVADFFVDAHNADCDAYEQRIAELKRRLGAMVEVFNEVACTPACNGECSRCTAEREMLKITKGIWDD